MKKSTIKSLSLTAIALALSFTGLTASAHEEGGMNNMMNNTATSTKGYNIMVMNHLCNANIKNMDDFKALEEGRDPIASLANTVLNCPATALPGDMAATGTVAAPRMSYDFKVMGEHHGTMWLSKDGRFMQEKLSEADINKDVDGNGMIASSTALDISHYEFPNTMADNARVEVTATKPASGFKFGTIRFTPPELIANNDEKSLLGTDDAQGRIQLDLTNDMDKKIMIHVYNFRTDMGNSMNGEMMSTTTERSVIVNQIRSLQQQILSLFSKIQTLLRLL